MPLSSEHARWFAEEVQPHEPELRAFLRKHFPTVQDTDDLVQEAYVRLIRARNAGAIAEPRAYLFATARNVAFDLFRRRRPISIESLEETRRSRRCARCWRAPASSRWPMPRRRPS